MAAKAETESYYLFANPKGVSMDPPASVFYKASSKTAAETLSKLFKKTFGSGHEFSFQPAGEFLLGEQILCDEAIDGLEMYSEPDPGVYDPAPPSDLLQRAQFAVQANTWQEIIDRRTSTTSTTSDGDSRHQDSSNDQWSRMPIEEKHNSGLIVFWMLAQAYYKLLEQTISRTNMVIQLDLNLNHSYLWVVSNLSKLLKNHPVLSDFPVKFEPYFNDLYPASILDIDWEDGVGSHAEEFLSTAQRYVFEKGTYNPEEGSAGYLFIEMFRPSIERALECASAYSERMRKCSKRAFATDKPSETNSSRANNDLTTSEQKRFKIALSFAGERRYFVSEVAEHLSAKFGREKILYDKYHEAELARVDLDVHLQNLYHSESELIVIFICSYYTEKQWCGLEWRALRDLIKNKSGHLIMTFRFDQTEVPGLFSTDGYIAVENRTPRDVASEIVKRLAMTF